MSCRRFEISWTTSSSLAQPSMITGGESRILTRRRDMGGTREEGEGGRQSERETRTRVLSQEYKKLRDVPSSNRYRKWLLD